MSCSISIVTIGTFLGTGIRQSDLGVGWTIDFFSPDAHLQIGYTLCCSTAEGGNA
jgi:hypothetical protein